MIIKFRNDISDLKYICTMIMRMCTFSIIWLFFSCNQAKEQKPKEVLDPLLVEFAGENYKDKIIEEITHDPADTIQMISFQSLYHSFDFNPLKKIESHHFDYKNIGITESYLTESWSLCNCIKDKSKKEILKPGESAKLNITFDPKLWKAGESKILTVYTHHYPHEFDITIERLK